MSSKKDIGAKNDQDKLRIDLIPPEVITALAKALESGASKYGKNNWANGINYSREWAAAQRHLWAWWSGETFDESGYNHLWHALSAIAILVALDARGKKDFDDRPLDCWK